MSNIKYQKIYVVNFNEIEIEYSLLMTMVAGNGTRKVKAIDFACLI